MKKATVRYCGGCNPRYERGEAYRKIMESLSDCVSFFSYQPENSYDLLLIVRGCTGCSYEYEEVQAKHRIYLSDVSEIPAVLEEIRLLSENHK